jgi:sigma-B regulation protein RsbU (phosphoserine phosphatase)
MTMESDASVARGHSPPIEERSQPSLLEALDTRPAMSAEELYKESLEEAFNIQQAMLPTGPLHLPAVELRFKYRPANIFSGDFLDYFSIGDSNLVGLYLGDVVGKGMPAALYAALAVGTLCGIHKYGETPDVVLRFLNRRLAVRNVGGRYCAVQYAVLDRTSRQLRFGNAGISPRPIHISEAGSRELGDGGFPCGMFKDVHYDVYSAQLNAGDTVLFSTDGLVEAQDPVSEPFGIERLLEICHTNRRESAEILLDRVFEAVATFTASEIQRDDMTAATLRLT